MESRLGGCIRHNDIQILITNESSMHCALNVNVKINSEFPLHEQKYNKLEKISTFYIINH